MYQCLIDILKLRWPFSSSDNSCKMTLVASITSNLFQVRLVGTELMGEYFSKIQQRKLIKIVLNLLTIFKWHFQIKHQKEVSFPVYRYLVFIISDATFVSDEVKQICVHSGCRDHSSVDSDHC